MVVKSIRWKTKGFKRLVRYVAKHRKRDEGRESFSIYHNLRYSEDLDEVAAQFRENDTWRKERKNGVVLYHDIISVGREDRAVVSPGMLEDLTRKYLELRAPEAIAFAMPHFDRDHVHVHVMISATDFKSSRSLRLDNARFNGVRRELECYQQDRYPELRHSQVYVGSLEKRRARQKEQAREVADRCLSRSTTIDSFFSALRAEGALPYDRGGKTVGIVLRHKKHRFKTLGLDLKPLIQRDQRKRELDRLLEERARRNLKRERNR